MMATPREIYRRMVAQIKPADIRLVAACMEDHIGIDNAVLLPDLASRVGKHERAVRSILSTLVVEYGIPIGAVSGDAGRFVIASEDERQAVVGDLASRVKKTNERIRALREAKLVGRVEPMPRAETMLLFDLGDEPRPYLYSWEV